MTDNEIIKALECCAKSNYFACSSCSQKQFLKTCKGVTPRDILDLINRQKAEIDKLKIEICALSEKRITFPERLKIVKHARECAIKEFANRLKKIKQMPLITNNDIDTLVKEMTESEE